MMKLSTLTFALYAMFAILMFGMIMASPTAAGEPGDLIGGQRPSVVDQMPRPDNLPDLGPADFALRLYRIEQWQQQAEQRLDKLDSIRQSGQPCNCANGGECTCGQNCQCGKPKRSGPAPFVDPVTGETITGPTIIQLSMDNCVPCVTWWGNGQAVGQRATYLRSGWATKQTKNAYAPVFPSYRIWDGKRWFDHYGPMNVNQFSATIGR